MKKQLALSGILSIFIFVLLIVVMQSPKPEGRQHAYGHRQLPQHALNIELKWMDLADQSRFELVQDTLQFQLARLEEVVGKQMSELHYCCDDPSMKLAHWGSGAYSLKVKMLFPTASSRNRAMDLMLDQGWAELQLKPNNPWEAAGSADLSLPGRLDQSVEIKNAAIKVSAHLELSQWIG